jgi:transcriptional regulator with XRE-family HTH domain
MAADDLRAEDVASDLHISHRTVTRWLEGSTEPTPTLARALGKRFEVDWRSFYSEPEPESQAAA